MLKSQKLLINQLHVVRRAGLLLLLSCFVAAGFTSSLVGADSYDQQIQSLQAQSAGAQAAVNGLQSLASNYQDAINKLQQQIAAMQSAIATNQTKQAAVQQQIDDDMNKIAHEKVVLGEDLKTMYVDGQMTTIEELATSNNLSEYVDKQAYREAVQGKIQSTLKELAALQAELQQQKQQLDVLIKTEQQQNDQLSAAESQQQQMLDYNQSQQAAYNAQIASNQSQIAQLRAAQAAANRRLDGSGRVVSSGSCGGSYPADASGSYGSWGCNYVHSSDYSPGCSYLDSWGMCNRECVSYTAWMVYENYGVDTSGFGNANQWPYSASRVGIPTGSTPKVGSVAIYSGGTYGHAMWVVGVSGDQVHVYSYNDGYDGNFYDHWVSASGLTFIYFGG